MVPGAPACGAGATPAGRPGWCGDALLFRLAPFVWRQKAPSNKAGNTGHLAGRPKHRDSAPSRAAGVARDINGDATSSSGRERSHSSPGGLPRLPSLLCVVFFLLVVQKLFVQPLSGLIGVTALYVRVCLSLLMRGRVQSPPTTLPSWTSCLLYLIRSLTS